MAIKKRTQMKIKKIKEDRKENDDKENKIIQQEREN
tara:strand:- start:944 stop:1051 length:108 start_codon:yes stop_codon:yes gene_type:complete